MNAINPAVALVAANALIRALAAERDTWKAAATDPGFHAWNGLCPDRLERDSRDPDCTGCQLLITTAKATALALSLPSAPGSPTGPPPGVDGATPLPGSCDSDSAVRGEHQPEAAA